MGGLRYFGQVAAWQRIKRRITHAGAHQGFTVVEVMIVLAVTGALFVAAAILISGKQSQAAFNEAIQQIQSQTQQVMNDVASGYFPNSGSFQCSVSPPGAAPSFSSVAPNGQGSNAGCIFVGKVLQFAVQATNPEKFAVYTLAGSQKDASGKEVTSLSAANPRAVAPGSSAPAGFPDLTVTNILQNGLTTTSWPHGGMWYNDGSADTPVGAVAFVTSFAQYGGVGGTISSGSQQLGVVPVSGSALDTQPQSMVDTINANLAGSPANPANGVMVCFGSGGTNESGLMTIGGQASGGAGHPLSVSMKVMDGTTTCGR